MARKPERKELENCRLLKEYASWIYCEGCGKTVAYLCYVGYDLFELEYACGCGSRGRVLISFAHEGAARSEDALVPVKNRLCCPEDGTPLLTIVEKHVKSTRFRVVCNGCGREYGGRGGPQP